MGINNYFNHEYISSRRFLSLYEQVKLLSEYNIENILEIGVGNGALKFFSQQMGRRITTFDFDADLNPDIVGSILEPIPVESNSFDAIVAFEVLEHVPFNQFSTILFEFSRIVKKFIIISVPNRCWYFTMLLQSDYFKYNCFMNIPRLFKKLQLSQHYDGDRHYWHIGDKHISLNTIKNIIISTGLTILKEYRSSNNPGHHFFILEKK